MTSLGLGLLFVFGGASRSPGCPQPKKIRPPARSAAAAVTVPVSKKIQCSHARPAASADA